MQHVELDMALRAAESGTSTQRLLTRCAALVVLLALLLGIHPPARAATGAGMSSGPAPTIEDEFLDLLNQARRSEGLRPLRRNEGVTNVAREWSETMARRGELSHRPDLRAPFDGDWRRLAENVGVGGSVLSLHRSFLASSGHRANMLADHDHVGIGVALAGPRIWVTVNFVTGDPDTTSAYRTNPLHGGYATGAGGGGPFRDVDTSTFRSDIAALDSAGAAVSCAERRFCPLEKLRRAEMAALLVRALDLPPAAERFRDVPASHPFAAEIGALAAAGVTLGCNPPANDRFCPEEPVTRMQMATFFTRAFGLRAGTGQPFTDVASSNVHARSIAALGRHGVTRGCNPPANDRFCPGEAVSRGQMSAFLRRGLAL